MLCRRFCKHVWKLLLTVIACVSCCCFRYTYTWSVASSCNFSTAACRIKHKLVDSLLKQTWRDIEIFCLFISYWIHQKVSKSEQTVQLVRASSLPMFVVKGAYCNGWQSKLKWGWTRMIYEQFPVTSLCNFYYGPLSKVCFVTVHCETCIIDILCKCVIDGREIKGSVLILMPVKHLLLLFIKEKLLIQVQSKAGTSFYFFFPTWLPDWPFYFFQMFHFTVHCLPL